MRARPTPSPAEAAAIAAAVADLLAAEAAAVPADPLPPAYRSPWRRAGMRPLPFPDERAGQPR
jgi:hypothetical protein